MQSRSNDNSTITSVFPLILSTKSSLDIDHATGIDIFGDGRGEVQAAMRVVG